MNNLKKVMGQKEFEKLSYTEIKQLNGKQDDESVLVAWRAGYIYLQQKIAKMSRTMYNEEFVDSVSELSEENLDCFGEW
jgi:hypothetical protein